MARFVVVTGTDTGVGKTFVAEALARALARERRVVAIKPFESGVTGDEPGDGERLAAATGQEAPRRALVRLAAPLAPAVAAEREGRAVDLVALVGQMRSLAEDGAAEVALVEGAGGLLSPLGWDDDAVTLAQDLGAAVVLVASDRLGTISVTHAALHVLEAARLVPSAVVLSAPATPDASSGTNLDALCRRIPRLADRFVALPRTDAETAAMQLEGLARRLADQPMR